MVEMIVRSDVVGDGLRLSEENIAGTLVNYDVLVESTER
jgi:hypothetical protein